MMRLWLSVFVLVVCLVSIIGCGAPPPRSTMTSGKAVIGVSEAAYFPAWKLAVAFQATNPKASISFQSRTNRQLVDSLLNERVEEIFLDRALVKAESLAFQRAGLKLYTYPVAFYPVFLLAAEGNPVSSLDSTKLREILTGTIRNWLALGGDDQSITPYLPLPGEGAFQTIVQYYGELDSMSVRICSTYAQMLDLAKDDEGALLVYSMPIENLPFKRLAFGRAGYDIPANVKTIFEEPVYPFRLDITYVTTHNKDDVAAGYLTYAVSNTGQREAMRLGYRPAAVPVRVVRMR
ncbi:hypothetical protein EHM69_01425 [candidate division KSB1 bacterium]|nr:MAG: hypothetical protein EHM69_01425 [candidate division KSB1 bacterium]